MLIEFSVANYRSFRERQTFTMVAAPRLHRKENTFVPVLEGEKFPALLKVAVIYGPNASGKSNLLRALEVFSFLTFRQPTDEYPLSASPFRFDPELSNSPSEFEVHFIARGTRYIFELEITRERIVREALTAFPKGREEILYERINNDNGDSYSFGSHLEKEAGLDILATWKKLTPPRSMFIVQAVANSSENLILLRPPLEWLKYGVRSILSGMRGMSESSRELAADSAFHASSLAAFLNDVDIPISKIQVSKLPSANALLASLRSDNSHRRTATRTLLTHRSGLGEAEFEFEEESEGTKNLVGFWLPWSIRAPKENKNVSRTLSIDELDASLHPNIVSSLVRKLIESDDPSQLIFSSHDTHLMDAKILRRDQIWLTERDSNGATKLRCIHDFEGRESEDVEKRYFEGRYRGLPILKG